ncbi:MAG: uracil-DNA glycosylase family protein [Variovorax sp.]
MSDEATLMLDARQRAMLDEMGVKVWWPSEVPSPAAALDAAPARDPQRTAAHVTSPGVVTPEPPRRPAPQRADAPVAVLSGEAVQIASPQLLYGGSAARGGWLVVADMPPGPDGHHGRPFDGDAGRLLDNMLRALQLHDGAVPVHLMRTHRGAAAADSRRFEAEAFAEAAASLAPRRVLAMGPIAAQCLLQRAEPLGKLRGRSANLAALPGVQVVATYHPAYLLRNPADKARAWSDLCLAAALPD